MVWSSIWRKMTCQRWHFARQIFRQKRNVFKWMTFCFSSRLLVMVIRQPVSYLPLKSFATSFWDFAAAARTHVVYHLNQKSNRTTHCLRTVHLIRQVTNSKGVHRHFIRRYRIIVTQRNSILMVAIIMSSRRMAGTRDWFPLGFPLLICSINSRLKIAEKKSREGSHFFSFKKKIIDWKFNFWRKLRGFGMNNSLCVSAQRICVVELRKISRESYLIRIHLKERTFYKDIFKNRLVNLIFE